MPLYTFLTACGRKTTHFRKIAERDDGVECACGCGSARRIIDAPFVRPEIPAYTSPVTGEWVNSRAQRRDDLARTNSLEWEPGIREDCERRRQASIEDFHSQVDATVDKTVAEMHASNLI